MKINLEIEILDPENFAFFAEVFGFTIQDSEKQFWIHTSLIKTYGLGMNKFTSEYWILNPGLGF